MQNFRTKNKKHIEDNFDLDNFKKETQKSYYRKRYSRTKQSIVYVNLLIGIFSIIISIIIYDLSNQYISLWRKEAMAKDIRDFVNIESSLPSQLPVFPASPGGSSPSSESDTAGNPTDISQTSGERIVSSDFKEYLEINSDVIGYIKIDNTSISEIVVLAPDLDYYLTRDLYKQPNVAGTIFMDPDNNIESFSDNTILYGHNMKNGTMFHDIRNYADNYYYQTHQYVTIKTLYDNTIWQVFSFYSTPTSFDYLKTDFSSSQAKESFIKEITSRSLHESDLEITADDKILTLSTCTNQSEDTRFVVHAKLISLTPLKG